MKNTVAASQRATLHIPFAFLTKPAQDAAQKKEAKWHEAVNKEQLDNQMPSCPSGAALEQMGFPWLIRN